MEKANGTRRDVGYVLTNATVVVVENIKMKTIIRAQVAKIAQAGNIKTKVAKADVKIATLDRT